MQKLIDKIKGLIKKYPRFGYEVKSFSITFLGTYIALTGITGTTNLSDILNNSEVFLGSIGLALFRTFIIYILNIINIDYRKSTVEYK